MFGSDDEVKLEKTGSEIKQSSWGEVEDDLLIEIKKRLLSHIDQVRFHAICKNWWTINQYKTTPLLPWIINIIDDYDKYQSVCNFYEPSPSSSTPLKPTFTYTLNFNEYDVSIHKYGWLLCTPKQTDCTHILLFSPFTNKSIKLSPYFWHKPFRTTFSIDPNSPHCVFLLVYDYDDVERITIKTFCHTYKTWRSREFDRPENFESCGHFPVYMRGKFYFVFPFGNLASYNVEHHEWKVESVIDKDESVIDKDRFPKIMSDWFIYEAFELNGELMLISINDWDGWGIVRRFDWSNKAWVPLESLGNYSLFCTTKSILVSQIGEEERKKGVLPNKIYFRKMYYHRSECFVYSLEGGTLTKFMSGSGIKSWDGPATTNNLEYEYWDRITSYHWFVPPKQWFSNTDTDIVNEFGNLEMNQTGEQSIDEQSDDDLESLIILDQMRRSRYSASQDHTATTKLCGKKGILRRKCKR